MNLSFLFADTLIPDVFITEYLSHMDEYCIKIYLYSIFATKHKKSLSIKDISKLFQIEHARVKDSLTMLENMELITWKDNTIIIRDIKEYEVKKLYRLKTTSTPEEAISNSQRNKNRNSVISSINNTFFQGIMSPSWYIDIDSWFDKYKFDEDVMMYLFRHCYDNRGLAKNYILKVAENWHSKNIQNVFDLEKYFEQYKLFSDIRGKIVQKLKLNRNLTEYEEKYVETWVSDYKYDFSIIEIALQKTTAKANPNFKYLNAIITNWHVNSLKTKQDIIESDKNYANKKSSFQNSYAYGKPIQSTNYEQREYDDDHYESFYDNFKE